MSSYKVAGLILGVRPANEGRRYFAKTYLIGWAQAYKPALKLHVQFDRFNHSWDTLLISWNKMGSHWGQKIRGQLLQWKFWRKQLWGLFKWYISLWHFLRSRNTNMLWTTVHREQTTFQLHTKLDLDYSSVDPRTPHTTEPFSSLSSSLHSTNPAAKSWTKIQVWTTQSVGCSNLSLVICRQQHTEAEREWLSSWKRHFEIEFLWKIILFFTSIFPKFVYNGTIDDDPALFKIMPSNATSYYLNQWRSIWIAPKFVTRPRRFE